MGEGKNDNFSVQKAQLLCPNAKQKCTLIVKHQIYSKHSVKNNNEKV